MKQSWSRCVENGVPGAEVKRNAYAFELQMFCSKGEYILADYFLKRILLY